MAAVYYAVEWNGRCRYDRYWSPENTQNGKKKKFLKKTYEERLCRRRTNNNGIWGFFFFSNDYTGRRVARERMFFFFLFSPPLTPTWGMHLLSVAPSNAASGAVCQIILLRPDNDKTSTGCGCRNVVAGQTYTNNKIAPVEIPGYRYLSLRKKKKKNSSCVYQNSDQFSVPIVSVNRPAVVCLVFNPINNNRIQLISDTNDVP